MAEPQGWQDWIGRSSSTTQVLDVGQANRLNATLDREATFQVGDVLPPAWQWLYFPDVVRSSRLGSEGHPALGVTMPPVPLTRRMWAGGRLDYRDEPLRLGSEVERVSTVRAVTPKEGRTGPLFFVTVEHEFRTGGVVNLREQQSIVYRELSPHAALPPAQTAPTGPDISAGWELDVVALFRYSALTFNAHRIHYDADYCRDVEGYPGVVVHGPLLATLLLDLAVRERLPVRSFVYRARNPLFLPQRFTVNGRREDGGTALWVADAAGLLAMEAVLQPD